MTNLNAPRVQLDPIDDRDRAQPGDVLGIENDGKTTELGDTREDEREKKQDAEEDVAEEVVEKRKNR